MEYIDLRAQYVGLREKIDKNIEQVLDEAQFIGGCFVDELERDLAAYVGRSYCIGCGNGTDALQLAYMAYGIGPGDAVFCPNMTFVASVEPAAMLGASPVFCDIDPNTYNVDVGSLVRAVEYVKKEGSLTPKAVVVVDFLGNPADMEKLTTVCNEHGLLMIEDAAQGIGGSYQERKLGSFGDISTTSFFPSKPLGCYGDGGAVFTDNHEIAELIRSLKVHGKGDSKYNNVRIGVNSRLDNIQAAVLTAKLKELDNEIAVRQEKASIYSSCLDDLVICPKVDVDCISAYAQYVVLTKDEQERSALMDHLKMQNIPTLIYYPKVISDMAGYANYPHIDCPVSLDYSKKNLGIPFSAYLTQDNQEKVIEAIQNFYKFG